MSNENYEKRAEIFDSVTEMQYFCSRFRKVKLKTNMLPARMNTYNFQQCQDTWCFDGSFCVHTQDVAHTGLTFTTSSMQYWPAIIVLSCCVLALKGS